MELSSLFLAGKGSALTSFFSTAFLVVFLPFCLVVYSLMPRRGKKYFLLAADCAFFWLISGKLLVYLLLTALSMHYFGLWLDKIQSETKLLLAQTEKAERKTVRKRQQAVQHRILLLAVILHIGVLFALKYSGFAATNVNTLLAHLHIPVQLAIPKYVMPIGISFFTLQALSYIVDVQRGITKADTNLLRLTLFISFFPQIVEGPICRYDQTAQQLWDAKPITYENLAHSLLRLLRRRRHVALDVLHHLALVVDHRRQVAEHRLHLVHLRRQRQNVLVTLTDDQVVVLEICIARVHAARYEEKNRSPVEFVLHFLGI